MQRAKFVTRSFDLDSAVKVEAVQALLRNLPVDAVHPLQLVVREPVKLRHADQNALMWAGPLYDLAEQGYVDGRRYRADVWHEHLKRELLPEQYDPALCKEGYRKWDFLPSGERVLVGSTTELTVKGMAQYITELEAFGASLGVLFHANPNDLRGL